MQKTASGSEKADGLNDFLQQYRVPYPPEAQVDELIGTLRQYVPAQKGYARARAGVLLRRMRDAAIGLRFMDASYWIITLLLYGMGAAVAAVIPGNPCRLLLVLGPLPVMLGLLEVFRGREENVWELELACKITPQEIVLSRLLTICLYNALLNVGLCGAIGVFYPLALLWRITMLWLAPMILAGGVSLWFCFLIRSEYAVLGSVSFWVAASCLLASQENWFEHLLRMNGWLLLLPLGIGCALFVKEIIGIQNHTYFEKRVSTWN